jgi:tetratricopeptide (TPR) repeat protein
MNLGRIELLKSYFEEAPDDPFNAYALALEYVGIDPEQANEYFQMLLTKHETYLPTYYQAGKFYQDTGKTKEAIKIIEKGIELAEKQRDTKTTRELRNMINELLMD